MERNNTNECLGGFKLGDVDFGETYDHRLDGAYVDGIYVKYKSLPTYIKDVFLHDSTINNKVYNGLNYIPKWIHEKRRTSENEYFKCEPVWKHGNGVPVFQKGE